MKQFYALMDRADGLVDVYLAPEAHPLSTEGGEVDFDISFRVVRGVDPAEYPDMEAHIRAHYEDWCEAAEVIWM